MAEPTFQTSLARRLARVKPSGGSKEYGEDVLAVDQAVRRLEKDDPRKGRIVNLRYFAGLTAKETAGVLGLSVGTIEREWRFIKTWLQVELAQG